jgi:hypothetical protein
MSCVFVGKGKLGYGALFEDLGYSLDPGQTIWLDMGIGPLKFLFRAVTAPTNKKYRRDTLKCNLFFIRDG